MSESTNAYSERLHVLQAWQRHYGMEPREDSKLTRLYCGGEIDAPPDQIARELMATDFIYKHTLYGELIEEFMRRVAAKLREQHGLSWKGTWEITRFYAPVALKLICLIQSCQCIPERMPPEPSTILPNIAEEEQAFIRTCSPKNT